MKAVKFQVRFYLVLLAVFLLSATVFATPNWDPNLTPVKLISSDDQEIVLDNTRWGFNFDGKSFSTIYKQARIRFDQVEQIFFCTEDFPPKCVASHIYLTFIFKSDKGMSTTDNKHAANGLVISVTNRLRQGEAPSSLAKAFFPRHTKDPWPLVFEVGTLADRLQNSLLVAGNDIKMYPLKLEAKSVERILRAGIELSLVDRSKDFYHVLFNNCVVEAFQILKKGLGESYFPDFWAIKGKMVSHNVSLPKLSAGYLKKRGLGSSRIDIARSSKVVSIPTSQGKLTYDIAKMQGFARAIPRVVPFALELQTYFEMAKASSDMQRLVDLVGISHPDCFKYLAVKAEIDYEIEVTANALLKFLKSDYKTFLDYYIDAARRNKLSKQTGFSVLNKAFIDQLNFAGSHSQKNRQTFVTYADLLRKL